MSGDRTITDAVAAACSELHVLWPCCAIGTCPVLDNRGIVAVFVYARGEGRLIVAGRAIELAPVEWGFATGASSGDWVGVLPASETPTATELTAGLAVMS